MNIGFLVQRNTNFKYFSSLIDEALKRNHKVFCLHDYSQPKAGLKGYQFPKIKQTPVFRHGKVRSLSFENRDEVLRKVKENRVDAIVSFHFTASSLPLFQELKKHGIKWISIQEGLDTIGQAQYLDVPDKYLLYSSLWLDFALKYLSLVGVKKEKRTLEEKVEAVGFLEIDHKEMIDREKVREKWGIPRGKKVVLFLPFPFGSHSDKFWAPFVYGMNSPFLQVLLTLFKPGYLKQVLEKENDKKLVDAVDDFCSKNNAYLLVKLREKNVLKDYLKEKADKIVYDEGFYPATVLECLSIADICFSFFSMAVMEAAFMGVPHVCLAPSVSDYKNIQGPGWQIIFKHYPELFDFKGVNYKTGIGRAIKELPLKAFSDFPFVKEKGEEYLEMFVGKGPVSEKCLKIIENLLKKE